MRTTGRCLILTLLWSAGAVAATPTGSAARLTRDEAVAAINGIVVPLITPVREDHSFDAEAMRALVDYLVDAGVHALFPCSVTGRFDLFRIDERRLIIATVVQAAAGRVPVYAGVDGATPEETIAQAKWAEQAGVDGVVVIPPGKRLRWRQDQSRDEFDAELSAVQDEVFEFCRRLHDEVGLYIIVHDTRYRRRRSPDIVPETFARLADLPRVIGVKKATRDVSIFPAIRAACNDRLAVMCGSEYVYLGALSMGASGGVVGGGANVYPQLILRLRERFLAGDLAGALEVQTRINEAYRRLRQVRDSRTIALQGLGLPVALDSRPEPEDDDQDEDDDYRTSNRWKRDATPEDRIQIQQYVRSLVQG